MTFLRYQTRVPQPVIAYQWMHVSPHIEGYSREVDYFRDPEKPGAQLCSGCSRMLHDHGWVQPNGPRVCPGDWIVKDDNDEISVWEDHDFHVYFEPRQDCEERE